MKTDIYDLQDFSDNPNLIADLEIVFTVKSFDLQAIRKRYLASRKRSRTGSVERREPAEGGIVRAYISNGEFRRQEIVARIVEARGIDIRNERLALSSDNKLYLFTEGASEPEVIENKWFSYIHTVKWSTDGTRLLVTSSGVDTIMELAADGGEILWEWNAWEHGINTGRDPRTDQAHILTRSPEEADQLRRQGKSVLLVTDPQADPLPTALRAAFINSAEYDDRGNVLATFFHDGKVVEIHKETGRITTLIEGLTKPHGGVPFGKGYLVTDTAGGRVVYHDDKRVDSYRFDGLPGNPESMGDLEWLQTSHYHGSVILTVDANRSALICFDPGRQEKMMVPFDPDWAVQDFVIMPQQDSLLEQAKRWFR